MLLFCMLASVNILQADLKDDVRINVVRNSTSSETSNRERNHGFPVFRGPTGPTGPRGSTGAIGPNSIKGDKGATGPRGASGSTGTQGVKGDKGATGVRGPKGSTGSQGDRGSLFSAGADLYTTLNRVTVIGNLFQDLPPENITTFGDIEYVAEEGMLNIAVDGLYLITYGAASQNMAPLEIYNATTSSVIPGTLIVTNSTEQLASRSIITWLYAGDLITLYCPTLPGIALETPPLLGIEKPVTAFLTIALIKAGDS